MSQESTDVLVAGYQDLDTATKDFESPVARAEDKEVEIEGDPRGAANQPEA